MLPFHSALPFPPISAVLRVLCALCVEGCTVSPFIPKSAMPSYPSFGWTSGPPSFDNALITLISVA